MAVAERGSESLPLLFLREIISSKCFLGVSPLEFYVHLENKEALPLEPSPALVKLALFVDQFNQKTGEELKIWEKVNDAQGRELTAKIVGEIKEGMLDEVGKILKEDENTIVDGPLFGSYPLLTTLAWEFPERIFPLRISGTKGTEARGVQIQEIPPESLNPQKTLIFFDDIVDPGVTLAQIVLERRKVRRKELESKNPLLVLGSHESLSERLAETFGQDYDNFEHWLWYDELARLMKEENVLLAAIFSKNQPLYEVIEEIAKEDKSGWGKKQLALLEKTCQLPNFWVVGAGLLDTNVYWQDIYERLSPKAQGRFAALGLREELPLVLRIGAASIEPLLALKNNDVKALQREFANFLSDSIYDSQLFKFL